MKIKAQLVGIEEKVIADDDYQTLMIFQKENDLFMMANAQSSVPNTFPFKPGANVELDCIETPEGLIITKITCTIETKID